LGVVGSMGRGRRRFLRRLGIGFEVVGEVDCCWVDAFLEALDQETVFLGLG
jgi:hypothetical protein